MWQPSEFLLLSVRSRPLLWKHRQHQSMRMKTEGLKDQRHIWRQSPGWCHMENTVKVKVVHIDWHINPPVHWETSRNLSWDQGFSKIQPPMSSGMKCRTSVRPRHPIWQKVTQWQTWLWSSFCSSPAWSSCCCSTASSWATSSSSCRRAAAVDRSGRTRRRCSCSPACTESGERPTLPFPRCRTGGESTCPCRSPSCRTLSPLPGPRPGRGPGWITGSGSWGRTAPPARGPWGRRAPSGPLPPRQVSAPDWIWPPDHGHTALAKPAGAGAHRFYRSPATRRLKPGSTLFRQTLPWWVVSI